MAYTRKQILTLKKNGYNNLQANHDSLYAGICRITIVVLVFSLYYK